MNVNGYEIKPFANLEGANLEGANLVGANLTRTILEKKEVLQDDKDLKIKELEEENEKLKSTPKTLLDT